MRLIYLIRNVEKALVDIEMRVPEGVKVPKGGITWWYHDHPFHIGELCIYASDRNFSGPIGVYDVDKPGQLRKLLEAFQAEDNHAKLHKLLAVLDQHGLLEKKNLSPPHGPGGMERTHLARELMRMFSSD